MNTTTITINWNDYEGYRAALNEVSMSTVNTFEKETDQFKVKSVSGAIKFTPERLIEALEHFECMRKRPVRELSYKRFLIWRYVYIRFDLTFEEIARITGYGHTAVVYGFKKLNDLERYSDIQRMKAEIYAYCDTIFK